MNKRTITYLLLAILIVGAALRLAGYDACSYTSEEIGVVAAAEEISAADLDVMDSLAIQSLYPELLVWWRTVFAMELWDRLPSLLFGIAAIWLTYLFVAEVLRFDDGSGETGGGYLKFAPLLAAAFVALNPALISLSWQLNPLALLPALVVLSMLAFAKVAREASAPDRLNIKRTLPWLLAWLLAGVIGCAVHPYFFLLALGQAVASGFLLSRNRRMILPLVLFALMSAAFVWMGIVNIVAESGWGVFRIAHKADAQGLLKIFNGGFLVLPDQARAAWYGVAMPAAAALIFGGALFSLFFRSGCNDLRDFCLPCMIPMLAVFIVAPTLFMPMSDPSLIVAVMPVVLAAAAGGVGAWGNRGLPGGAVIAVAVLSLIAFGFSLHERYALPDYRPVAEYLEQNAGDSPVVHISMNTYRYVGVYRDEPLYQRWEPLWVIDKPLIRGNVIDYGEELFIVADPALVVQLFNGSTIDFLKQIMMPDWEIVETKDLGDYTVYRIRRPKKSKLPDMSYT